MLTLSEAFESTAGTTRLLEELRATPHERPELNALRVPALDDFVRWEHLEPDGDTWFPLLEHAHAAVARYFACLDGDENRFDSLDGDHFSQLGSTAAMLEPFGLSRVIRATLTLCDFAKGGTANVRAAWDVVGVDLTVHNTAAAELIVRGGLTDELGWPEICGELLVECVANHGLAGQFVRGETPRSAFRRWAEWLGTAAPKLAAELGVTENQAITLACNTLFLVDVCDTAAVRPGLVDDRLLDELIEVRNLRIAAVDNPMLLLEPRPLDDRLKRLRRQALERGEPLTRLNAALAEVGPAERVDLDRLIRQAQLWYFEPATHRMSTLAALKLLFLGLTHANEEDNVDASRPFHLSFQPLVDALGAPDSAAAYRVRLVEALLAERTFAELASGDYPTSLLGKFLPRIGGDTAVALTLEATKEANALVTLLAIYEGRSSVAFHQILKLLCDAYGLRKDEFDRLANEAQYLETMNSSRSDKERMLDFTRPGTIVEIGPGGGVVLDLLAERFSDSDVVGLDISHEVIEELERRRELERKRWRVIEGDAFELTETFEPNSVDTIVFCSVLHEIYSYVDWEGAKFQLDSVRAMLQAAYDTLAPGGRIIIRDGVKPPDATRVIEFLDPDGPDFLRRFAEEFDGREIEVQWRDETTAVLSAADAMEFLYCYTWGPASFPYEVREQYGIMERAEYEENVIEWLSDDDSPARAVDVADLASYLQPGYPEGLAPKIVLKDETGDVVDLPDSNAVWVFEKA